MPSVYIPGQWKFIEEDAFAVRGLQAATRTARICQSGGGPSD
jgi:hypothetical protein